jgi:uncharacterized protein
MTSIFHEVSANKVFVITIMVWIIAQGLKVFFGFMTDRRFNFRWFIGTGGMPSSHAAGVTALAMSTGFHLGFDSVTFAVSAVFAMVTMFDAQGVRRSTGQQAQILNKIIDDIYWRGKVEPNKLKELIGHTPFQVLAGFSLGLALSSYLYYRF